MEEPQKIGKVFTYFSKVGVAGIKITDAALEVGDTIQIKGATTDFTQEVESLEVDRKPLQRAEPGQEVGLKVKDKVRKNDIVYKLQP